MSVPDLTTLADLLIRIEEEINGLAEQDKVYPHYLNVSFEALPDYREDESGISWLTFSLNISFYEIIENQKKKINHLSTTGLRLPVSSKIDDSTVTASNWVEVKIRRTVFHLYAGALHTYQLLKSEN